MRPRASARGAAWTFAVPADAVDAAPRAPAAVAPPEIARPAPPAADAPLDALFAQLSDHLESSEAGGSAIARLDREALDARSEHGRVAEALDRYASAFKGGISARVWTHKQFFTELADLIDHAGSIDLADVNPEYRDVGAVVERLKDLRTLDPDGYKKARLGITASEIFEFFCGMEMSSFSFKSPMALISLPWIQAAWFWTEEEGNPDAVPKVFEKVALPIMAERLEQEIFQTVGELEIAFAHCVEASDYCRTKIQLLASLKPKIEWAYRWHKISKADYERLLATLAENDNGPLF
jgi:hypothetical protein